MSLLLLLLGDEDETPPASTEGRPGRRIQPPIEQLPYWDDEEALIVMET
jgi:hypothetical protein